MTCGYRHEALLYSGMDDYAAQTSAFVSGGLAEGAQVVVAVPRPHLEVMRESLGDEAAGVRFIDMAQAGRNPGAIIALWRGIVEDAGDRPLRAIGEPIWPGRSDDELAECHHHEALLNEAFSPATPLWLVCPYDVTALDPATIDCARRRHPLVRERGRVMPSDRYENGSALDAALSDALPPAPRDAVGLAFDALTLGAVRAVVARSAQAEGVPRGRVDELVLAAHEVAANSVRHGGGRGRLRFWRSGDRAVCEISDAGVLRDALAGRHNPQRGATGGRGLWLAHQLCDLVQIRSGPQGTVVRLHVALADAD